MDSTERNQITYAYSRQMCVSNCKYYINIHIHKNKSKVCNCSAALEIATNIRSIALSHTLSPVTQLKLGQIMKSIKRIFIKGQLISKCPFGVIVWTKIPMKKFDKFLP